ncbi:hypothetical protein [Ktedonospora formicarum]|uniref:Lipoprotein n=1 Tax=Ktedonospora formicarum TaxID=2778364 RepID=A0A8J3I7X7_9CHLR|nr:hypothetical protein [Ktedonospora formicarum]GHO46344.1 hypothetical protein KSX_45070 [Ktedonospora formicarum]
MRFKNVAFHLLLALLLTGLLAACDSSGTAGSVSTPTTTNESTPTTTLEVNTPTATSGNTPAATPTQPESDSSVVVSVGKVPSHQAVGVMMTTLTTRQGMTLYIRKWRGASGFTCDAECRKTWTPYAYHGQGQPTSTTRLPGKLSLGTDEQEGTVVLYQGYYLFTNVNDKAPGDFKAPLADNSVWDLATPDVPTGL